MTARVGSAPAKSDFAVAVRAGIPGLLALGLGVIVLSGGHLPYVSDDRGSFLILLGLGWMGCTAGIGPTFTNLGWRHPIVLAGIALGICALGIVAAVLIGGVSDRVGFMALEGVLLTKWALGQLRFLLR